MTKYQIGQIYVMRIKGMGPTKISRALDIPFTTVASYVRNHPIPEGMMICKNCGKLIQLTPGKKIRQYCSESCKNAWWNEHRYERRKSLATVTCQFCGKEFRSYKSEHRRYCSRECYTKARNEAIQ